MRFTAYFLTAVLCLCRRHYWAFKVEPHSYMVKVGVASDSKLLEWFHNPRDTSSPRFVSPSVPRVHARYAATLQTFGLSLRFYAPGMPDTNGLRVFESYIIL